MIVGLDRIVNLNHTLINETLAAHPYPLLFVTISGAHLYGFDSANSDYDLRGAHVTPVRKMLGLAEPNLTHELMDKSKPIEIDLVTHDIRKFFQLLLKNNGYVLEQVMSPIVLHSTPEFDELKSLAPRTITRHHHHHFRNFAQNQWDLFSKAKPTVKGLLYAFRVVLAGIHLMDTHQVESNLRRLNESFKLGYIDDLIAQKIGGQERDEFKGDSLAFLESEFTRLMQQLEDARSKSSLPDEPTCRTELNDLLIRTRLQYVG